MITDIGGYVQQARTQRGLSLRDAARRTKLPVRVFEAIERNDFDSLPAGLYRKAHLRTVARELGLDPDELSAAYEAQYECAPMPDHVVDAQAAREAQWLRQLTPSPRRSLIRLAGLIALATAWFALRPGVLKPPAFEEPAALAPAAVRVPMAWASTAVVERPGDQRPFATTPSPGDAPLRVEMTATNWCWVAAAADGKRVLYRMMEPGERILLEGQHVISLRLGDAGSMTLSINDGVGHTIGGEGEVIEFELTPENIADPRIAGAETVSGN